MDLTCLVFFTVIITSFGGIVCSEKWWSECKVEKKEWMISVFFSSRRRHTRYWRDWSSDVCSSDPACGLLRYAVEQYGPPLASGRPVDGSGAADGGGTSAARPGTEDGTVPSGA